jgi:uncharacterized phiE125 gp8 family phage protein
MTARIITPPVAMAVSLADARNAARIDGTDSDADIEIQVRTFTADAEHMTGRAIINRTYRITLDAFPDVIELPPPLISVTSVKYFDLAGVEQTIDQSAYIVDLASEPGRITPLTGTLWPCAQKRIGAVNVVAVCGYGTDDKSTPAAFKGYILAKVREYFAPAGTPVAADLCDRLQSLKVYG